VKRITDLPKALMPREKMINSGPESLLDRELLAILLGTGMKNRDVLKVSEEILNRCPVRKLLGLNYEELVKVKGIGDAKATTILAAFELGKRALDKYDVTMPMIDSPQRAMDQLTKLKTAKKEFFVVLYLNARNQLVHRETISMGTVNSSLVHPREVFEPAIKYLAVSVILAHNHPSGELIPSEEDRTITQRLIDAGKILGIDVLDHLLVTKRGFESFKEKGWIW
jgi:DNA repair protein RadC